MSCCGQKRLAFLSDRGGERASHSGGAAVSATAVALAGVRGRQDVMLRYLALGAFSIRSTRTGRAYACTGTGAGIPVDPRDVDSLLRTRLFARA